MDPPWRVEGGAVACVDEPGHGDQGPVDLRQLEAHGPLLAVTEVDRLLAQIPDRLPTGRPVGEPGPAHG